MSSLAPVVFKLANSLTLVILLFRKLSYRTAPIVTIENGKLEGSIEFWITVNNTLKSKIVEQIILFKAL